MGVFMLRIYIWVVGLMIVVGAYWVGGRIATAKCKQNVAITQNKRLFEMYEIKRCVNEKTFNTRLGDIRRVLHDKYTIAD